MKPETTTPAEDGADELSKADAKAPTDSGEPACSAPKEVQ